MISAYYSTMLPRLGIMATRHHSTGFHFQRPLQHHRIIINNVAPLLINQKRYYYQKIENNDIDYEGTLATHNKLSRRLYRSLLRSCKRDIIHANKNNSIDCSSSFTGNVKGLDEWILLQPKMDQRKYGFAKFVKARRGGSTSLQHNISSVKSLDGVLTKNSIDVENKDCANKAISKMSKDEVGMAMEVLNFVHVALGGNRYDNLEEYYLGEITSDSDGEDDDDRESITEESDSAVERESGASAGKHSEGHYTRFIDDDPERGEGEEEKDHNRKVGAANADGDDKSEEDNDDYTEWDSDDDDVSDYNSNNIDHFEPDDSVLVTANDLQNAIRIAFHAPLHLPQDDDNSDEEEQTTSSIISRRHRDAIDASLQLSQQIHLWKDKSSISIDWERGVRVVVTSSLMMRSNNGVSKKNRFAYKIRVENIVDIIDEMKKKLSSSSGSDSEESGPVDDDDDKMLSLGDDVEHRAVQLLGRSWAISERGPWNKTSVSLLQQLLEDGVVLSTNNGSSSVAGKEADGGDDDDNELRVVQTLNEPTTGAGECLEQYSSTIPVCALLV